MYVFLSDVFYWISLTPIFKKLDAFIPALPLLGTWSTRVVLFMMFHHKTTRVDHIMYQPLCVSFYYIYIVNVCFFEWHILCVYIGANFQKAGRLHSCLTPARQHVLSCCLYVFVPQKRQQESTWTYQPLCVSFYYIIYIVNVCIFE